MIVKCLYNTGEVFKSYKHKPLGVSNETTYGGVEINKVYIVMGIVLDSGFLRYIVDDSGIISMCPSQLFEIIENAISSNWYFINFPSNDPNFINREAIWGYYDLVFDNDHYFKLIDGDHDAERLYFKRKEEEKVEMNFYS